MYVPYYNIPLLPSIESVGELMTHAASSIAPTTGYTPIYKTLHCTMHVPHTCVPGVSVLLTSQEGEEESGYREAWCPSTKTWPPDDDGDNWGRNISAVHESLTYHHHFLGHCVSSPKRTTSRADPIYLHSPLGEWRELHSQSVYIGILNGDTNVLFRNGKT